MYKACVAKRRTQAVVVIHGMGEQTPMSTVREFVEAVLPDPPDGGPRYFSKPDRLADHLELRKLQNRSQPRTHFYEYYWANKAEGTRFVHVLSWLRSLLLRRPGRVPPHLRSLWWSTWLLAVVAVGSWIAYGLTSRTPSASVPFWAGALATAGLGLLQVGVTGYVGDAARYLSPRPGNIALRQRIRADGLGLLRALHDQKKPDGTPYYDRIVVVGHSLGSVIGYDLIKHLWPEIYRDYRRPHPHEQSELAALEKLGASLREEADEADVRAYQAAQVRLWWELQELGHPWRVTDFVTLGSPLAHAALLLADDEPDLRQRQEQRELPTCPPIPELDEGGPKYSYRVWEKYFDAQGQRHVLRALHHAAPFAVVRWTNIYFPNRALVLGDPVAGPIAPWFGPGVLDRVGSIDGWPWVSSPLAHTAYWRGEQNAQRNLALRELVDALDDEGRRTYRS